MFLATSYCKNTHLCQKQGWHMYLEDSSLLFLTVIERWTWDYFGYFTLTFYNWLIYYILVTGDDYF